MNWLLPGCCITRLQIKQQINNEFTVLYCKFIINLLFIYWVYNNENITKSKKWVSNSTDEKTCIRKPQNESTQMLLPAWCWDRSGWYVLGCFNCSDGMGHPSGNVINCSLEDHSSVYASLTSYHNWCVS